MAGFRGMKKLIIFALLLLVPIAMAATEEARGLPRNCYQNYTALVCGFQDVFNLDEYCSNISLSIDDCYTEGDNFTLIFSGIKYFQIPGGISRLDLNLYSRNWAWIGEQNTIPLPENSTISAINETAFMISSSLPEKKVESAQITIPACYKQVDKDNNKVYLRTQAGKICTFKSAEAPAEQPSGEVQTTATQTPEKTTLWGINRNGILLAVIIAIIIAAFIIFRARKPAKK